MTNIRLNKESKTIKIVNRKDNIRLKKQKTNINLQHTGRTGPTGLTGISTFVRAHHENDPNYARPDAIFVEWVGSIAPINATTEDTWIHTPAL